MQTKPLKIDELAAKVEVLSGEESAMVKTPTMALEYNIKKYIPH